MKDNLTYILEKKNSINYTNIDTYILDVVNKNAIDFINQNNIHSFCKKYGFSLSSLKRFINKYECTTITSFKLLLQSKLTNNNSNNCNIVILDKSIDGFIQNHIVNYVNNISKILNYVNWKNVLDLISQIKVSNNLFINVSNNIFTYEKLKIYSIINKKQLINIDTDALNLYGFNFLENYKNSLLILIRYKKEFSKGELNIIDKFLKTNVPIYCFCDKSFNINLPIKKISINNIDAIDEDNYLTYMDSFQSIWSIIYHILFNH